MSIKTRSLIAGIAGAAALLSLYFVIVTLAQSFSHAVETFSKLWLWIAALVAGFGTQVGLYYYIRASLAQRHAEATASVAAAGGMSTTAMVACCAHHLSDVLPLIGLSAAAVVLVKYQLLFIIMGVLSSVVGIVFMLSIVQQHSLYDEKGRLGFVFGQDLKQAFKISAVLAAVVFAALVIAALGGKISVSAPL